MRQCFGLTRTLRRCRRKGKWLLFCPDHRKQPIVFVATVSLALLSLVADFYTVRWIWGPSKQTVELRREVYLHIDMACHGWKNAYLSLHRDPLSHPEREYLNIWEALENEPGPPYSETAYMRFLPLFDIHANLLIEALDSLMASNSDILPRDLRSLMLKTMAAIERNQRAYRLVPMMVKDLDSKDGIFEDHFHEMVRDIAQLSLAADRLRNGD